jgi:hypothetical protein
MYVIWSYEHQAWWAPGRHGYTRDLSAAGRYAEIDARDILSGANGYGEIEEVMIPVATIEPMIPEKKVRRDA